MKRKGKRPKLPARIREEKEWRKKIWLARYGYIPSSEVSHLVGTWFALAKMRKDPQIVESVCLRDRGRMEKTGREIFLNWYRRELHGLARLVSHKLMHGDSNFFHDLGREIELHKKEPKSMSPVD